MWSWLSFIVGGLVGIAIGAFLGVAIMAVVSYGRCARCEEDRITKIKF